MRSEYFDVTGRVFTPKDPQQPIEIITEKVTKPYVEIGTVKVMAPLGTSKEAINEEMKRRARNAGADALIDVQIGEDVSNKVVLCGKLLSTNRNITSIGKAIVFTPIEKDGKGSFE